MPLYSSVARAVDVHILNTTVSCNVTLRMPYEVSYTYTYYMPQVKKITPDEFYEAIMGA